MGAVETKAEVYVMALQSLTREERKAVLSRLLDDAQLRQDVLDIALIRQRQGEPARPFRAYLSERKKRSPKD